MTTDTKERTAFDEMMAQTTAVKARFEAGAAKIIAHAESLGATVTKEEVTTMPCLRIYALGGGGLDEGESYERELYAISQIREAKRRAILAQEIKAGEGAAHEQIQRMGRADRMEFARRNLDENTNGNGNGPAVELSKEEKLKILLEMPPAARIAQSRAWGMSGQE